MSVQLHFQPYTDADKASVKENQREVDTVVRFFMFAPPVCILEVRDKLLREGFELTINPAPMMILDSAYPQSQE